MCIDISKPIGMGHFILLNGRPNTGYFINIGKSFMATKIIENFVEKRNAKVVLYSCN